MHLSLDLASIALASLLLNLVVRVLYKWYRLCHIPGPFWWTFISYWGLRNPICAQVTSCSNKVSSQYDNSIALLSQETIGS